MQNNESQAGTEAQQSTEADLPTSGSHNAKPHVSRRFKFRAWDMNEMTFSTEYNSKEFPNENLADFLNDCYGCDLMEWSGYTDKNEKDIYEGDIISSPNKQITKGIIYFSQGSFWYKEWDEMYEEWHHEELGFTEQYGSKKHGILHWSANRISLEVIGNVYENPELCRL